MASDIDSLISQHFSITALERSSAPVQKLLSLLADWLSASRSNPYPMKSFHQLTGEFGHVPMPVEGITIEKMLEDVENMVLPNTAQLNHPSYIGHMTQALPWISLLAETLAAALNQNQVKVETAFVSTLIEKQVLGWIHRQVYRLDEETYARAISDSTYALGNMVNGGTMGNLTALAVALERQLPGCRKKGIHAVLAQSEYQGVAVVCSQRAHYSIKKAVATLGLGEDALHLLPVGRDNRVDASQVRAKLVELRLARIKPIALVGIAGTTETGAIDPLAALAEIARDEGVWFHVDAAWGGALMLASQFRQQFGGIEFADSVVIDGHKLLWVPMAQGMVLFRNRDSLDCLAHTANYIIRENSPDLGRTSLEGSRRFDSFKLWIAFKVFGLQGYEMLLRRASGTTRKMRDLIAEHSDFELITESGTFILTYRYVPAALRMKLRTMLAAGDTAGTLQLNAYLNLINASIQEEQKVQGRSFVSRTILESTEYPGSTTVLRVVLSNVFTEAAHLRAVLSEQQELGEALMRKPDAPTRPVM